jgi:uncharacterized Zn finger protein (UPF0148 family)
MTAANKATGSPHSHRESPSNCPCRSRTYTLLIQSQSQSGTGQEKSGTVEDSEAGSATVRDGSGGVNPSSSHDRSHDARLPAESRSCWRCRRDFVARRRDEVFCSPVCGIAFRKERAAEDARRTALARQEARRERRLTSRPAVVVKPRPRIVRARTGYYRSSPEQQRANAAVGRAVRRGHLVRAAACEECGRTSHRIEAHHHRGYARQYQLDVQWLCSFCHGATKTWNCSPERAAKRANTERLQRIAAKYAERAS